MKTQLLILTSLLILLQTTEGAHAQTTGNNCAFYAQQTVVAVVGVINAGSQQLYSPSPGCHVAHSTTQVFTFVAEYSGPFVAGIGTITWGTSSFSGCNIAALTTTTNNFAASANSRAASTITMTSTECHGFINFDLSIGTPVVYDWPISVPIDIRVEQPNFNFLCAAPEKTANAYAPSTDTCQEPQLNNLNYLCAATGAIADNFNEATTTCTTPTINAAVSGNLDLLDRLCAASALGAGCTTPTINAAITGTLTTTLTGTLDLLDRLCNASATGAACTTPTINAIISGTLDNLNRLCDDSTFNSACNEVHFTADLLNRLCGASATNTTCTAPTIATTLQGALAVGLSGIVHPCSTALLLADPHACDLNTPASNNNLTLNAGNFSIPMNFRAQLCGAATTNTTCAPLTTQSTATSPDLIFLTTALVALLATFLFGAANTPLAKRFAATDIVRLVSGALMGIDGAYAVIHRDALPEGTWFSILLLLLAVLFIFWVAIEQTLRSNQRQRDAQQQRAADSETLQ